MKKILFIGINHRYFNLSNYLLPSMLVKKFDVCFFGPGYVEESILNRGLDHFMEINGGVDFIFVTAQCISSMSSSRLNNFINRYTYLFNSSFISDKFLEDVGLFTKRNRNKVICGISEIDPHNIPQLILDSIYEHAKYFMGWGHQFLESHFDIEAVKNEKYIQRKISQGIPLGLIDKFAKENKVDFISLGHFIGDSEYYWNDIRSRPQDVTIPGVKYHRRQKAIEAVRDCKGLMVGKNNLQLIYKILDLLRFRPFNKFPLINLYNLQFQKQLFTSKICITDGGANNYPVRKFFEIPASGALLACWPAAGINHLGFIHKKNYFSLDQGSIEELVNLLDSNLQCLVQMANDGRRLIIDNHSIDARSTQFYKTIETIAMNKFCGSEWRDGKYIINS
jgi:hypothetical protein